MCLKLLSHTRNIGNFGGTFKSNMSMSATRTFDSAPERNITIGATRNLALKFLYKLLLKNNE